jgi:hypothetical protein
VCYYRQLEKNKKRPNGATNSAVAEEIVGVGGKEAREHPFVRILGG